MTKVKRLLLSTIALCLFLNSSAINEQENEYDSDDDYNLNNYNRWDEGKHITEFERKIWKVTADLYKGVNQNEEGNFAVSPLSLTTLMMMLNGGGETAREIQHLFKLGNDSEVAMQNHTQVLESLRNQTADKDLGVELVTASRIIAHSKNSNIRPDYKTAVNSLGEVETFDFANPKSVVEKTNEWVKNQTRGKISKLVEEEDFTDETAAVLLNAVYFKAPWKIQFNKSKTKQEDFQVSETKKVKVDMMHISTEFPYANLFDLEATVVFLPYKGDRMSMIIYLPWARSNLSNLEEKLETLVPSEIRNQAAPTDVSLYLPKFNISSSIDLKPVLSSLGVQKMFKREEADFSKISKSTEFYVSKVRQHVFVEVNEEGGERPAPEGLIPTFCGQLFKVDGPFIFQIFDDTTRRVLLTGRITNPNGNEPLDSAEDFEWAEDAFAGETDPETSKNPSKIGGAEANPKSDILKMVRSFLGGLIARAFRWL